MVLDEMINAMTPDVYQRLLTAVETGKWADGVALTDAQKENSLQLVMMWQAKYNEQPQHMSIGKGGEMVTKSKKELKEAFGIVDDTVTRIRLQ
ncbi:YeaC family protein [Erwinia tasmaniensis]|uniref:YeaC family protein n=1 Tax=Erwinia tasmaniensis TaxID=338565 RepID=UPI003A4D68D9